MPRILEFVTKREAVVRDCDDCGNSTYDEDGSAVMHYEERPSDNLDGVYHLVRNCHIPEMFSFPSPEARMSSLEAENKSLTENNERLMKEVAELRSQLASLPNKRAKTDDLP